MHKLLLYSKSGECIELEDGDDHDDVKCTNFHDMSSNVNKSSGETSPLMLGEKICERSEQILQSDTENALTFEKYEQMEINQKNKIKNRVRQWALKARNALPNEHGMFCLVLSHLFKNAHKYFNMEKPSDFQKKLLEDRSISE